MKAVVFAYHDMGCLGIEALLAAGYEISAIFTHTDNPWRKSILWFGRSPGGGKRDSGLRAG